MTTPYETAYQQSIQDPDGFWGAAAEDCHWYKNGTRFLMTVINPSTAGLPAQK